MDSGKAKAEFVHERDSFRLGRHGATDRLWGAAADNSLHSLMIHFLAGRIKIEQLQGFVGGGVA